MVRFKRIKRRFPRTKLRFVRKKRRFTAPLFKRNIRISGLLGLEKKFVDTFRSGVTLQITPAGSELDDATMLCLNGVDVGNTQSTRIGNKITIVSLQVNGTINNTILTDTADAPTGDVCRIFIVWDKQTNGAQLNAEDVYENTSATDLLSFRKIEFAERFQVLKEWVIQVDYTANATDGANTATYAGEQKYFSFFRKLNMPVKYTTTGATVSSIMDNSLHIIGFSINGKATISWTSRIRYTG